MQMISYFFDYKIWKLNSFGYHLTNVSLHTCVAYLIFLLLTKLFSNQRIALFSSILFVTFPIHSTVVAYIASRADILATLFMLIAMITFIDYLNNAQSKSIILSLCSYSFALLSRENALIFPLLLLSSITLFPNKKKIIFKYTALLLIITFFYVLLRNEIGIKPTSIIFDAKIPIKLWLVNFLHIIKEYTLLIFFPTNLRICRTIPFIKNIGFLDLAIAFIFILLFVLLIKKRNVVFKRQLIFLALWLVITIMPIARLMFIFAAAKTVTMSENWLYFPAVAMSGLLGYFLFKIEKKYKILCTCLFILIFSYYSFNTIKFNKIWKSDLKFYNYLVDSPRQLNTILFNRAKTLTDHGNYDEAIRELNKILIKEPSAWQIYLELGQIYHLKKETDNALKYYHKILELQPKCDSAYFYIGIINLEQGNKEKAFDNFIEALEINPNLWPGYFYAGNLLLEKNLHKEAILCFKKNIELRPDFAMAYVNLGVAYGNNEQFKNAIAMWNKALNLGADKIQVKKYIEKANEIVNNKNN